MKRIAIAGLCLVAVMAVSAMSVASASAALPEFKANKFPVAFSSHNLLPLEPTLHSTTALGEKNVKCKMSLDKGEILNAKLVAKVTVLYTGCVEEGTTNACTSTGEPKGAIVTSEIHGIIGYITGHLTEKLVGTELLPENTSSNNVFATFVCEGPASTVIVEGCTIGQASPINVSQPTGNLLFEELAGGGQKYTSIDGGSHQPCVQTVTASILKLKGTGWIMDEEHEEFVEPVELKA